MSGRSLAGAIGVNTFETDDEQFTFTTQDQDVLILTPDGIQLPTYTTNGFLRTTGGDGTVEVEDINLAPLTLDPQNGRVGINNATPQQTLDVSGNIHLRNDTVDVPRLSFTGQNGTSNEYQIIGNVNNSTDFGLKIEKVGGAEGITFIGDSGSVGIGTDTPSEKLDIVGNATISDTLKLSSYDDGFLKTTNGTVGVDTTLEGRVASLESELPIDLLPITLNKTFNRVGINASNPIYTLQVGGDVAISGQVIGATNLMRFPQEITGQKTTTTIAGATNNDKFLRFRTGGGNPVGFAGIQFSIYDGSHVYMTDVGHHGISFFGKEVLNATKGSIGDHIMTIKRTGNVGIGTTSPSQKLHVNGNITADAYSFTGTSPLGHTQLVRLTRTWNATNTASFVQLNMNHGLSDIKKIISVSGVVQWVDGGNDRIRPIHTGIEAARNFEGHAYIEFVTSINVVFRVYNIGTVNYTYRFMLHVEV